jgi:uncharacterized membrane protein (UPF0127 family)
MKRLLPLIFTLCFMPTPAQSAMPQVELVINKHALTAEVASNDADRMQGLMHRRMMPESRGMLFVFPNVAYHGMWMMNTYIPLSVAFIDEAGAIINIEDMQPHTRDSHSAKNPARYALEMNLGWFRKRGIKPGMKVEGLEKAPAPR